MRGLSTDLVCADVPAIVTVTIKRTPNGPPGVVGLEIVGTGCVPNPLNATSLRSVQLKGILAATCRQLSPADRLELRNGRSIVRHVLLRQAKA